MSVVGEAGIINLDMTSQNLVLYSDETSSVTWQPWGDNIDLLMIKAFADARSLAFAVADPLARADAAALA